MSKKNTILFSKKTVTLFVRLQLADKLLTFIVMLIEMSPQMSLPFLEYDGGISIMRYLLERMAKAYPLSVEIFTKVSSLMDIIIVKFPHLVGAFSEMLLLNGDIWIDSQENVQKAIVVISFRYLFRKISKLTVLGKINKPQYYQESPSWNYFRCIIKLHRGLFQSI